MFGESHKIIMCGHYTIKIKMVPKRYTNDNDEKNHH